MQVSMLPSQSGAFQAIVVNNPGGQSVGPVMKVKHFRIHAVTDQTILFNWALIYAPDGIGVPQIHPPGQYSQIAEPQQFVIASGTYLASPSSAGAVSPLRYYSPLARNLNPGDGIYLRMSAASASSIPVVWTISFVTCVNWKPKSKALVSPDNTILSPHGVGVWGMLPTPERSDSGPAAQALWDPEASGRRVPL